MFHKPCFTDHVSQTRCHKPCFTNHVPQTMFHEPFFTNRHGYSWWVMDTMLHEYSWCIMNNDVSWISTMRHEYSWCITSTLGAPGIFFEDTIPKIHARQWIPRKTNIGYHPPAPPPLKHNPLGTQHPWSTALSLPPSSSENRALLLTWKGGVLLVVCWPIP